MQPFSAVDVTSRQSQDRRFVDEPGRYSECVLIWKLIQSIRLLLTLLCIFVTGKTITQGNIEESLTMDTREKDLSGGSYLQGAAVSIVAEMQFQFVNQWPSPAADARQQ